MLGQEPLSLSSPHTAHPCGTRSLLVQSMWDALRGLTSAAPPPPPPPPLPAPPPLQQRRQSPPKRVGADRPQNEKSTPWLGTIAAGMAAAGALGAFALSRYRRCAPNQVLVIFGRTGLRSHTAAGKARWEGRVQHGGGAFVWPIIQDYAYMSLEPLAIDIDLKGALSHEKIRLNIPTVVSSCLCRQPSSMLLTHAHPASFPTRERRSPSLSARRMRSSVQPRCA